MAVRSGDDRPRNGGVPARRAIARWAWRLFRREWRQQLLVLTLLTVAITAVIFGATAAYNMIPSGAAKFGTANVRLVFTAPDPASARADVAIVAKQVGAVDVIQHVDVAVPGSVDTVEVRAQDPHGPYGAGMLALRDGRYPTRGSEVALTHHVADLFHASVGRPVSIGGVARVVVGLVENPADLNDEFALVTGSPAAHDNVVAVLARYGPETDFAHPGADCTVCRKIGGVQIELRGAADQRSGAALVLGLSTVALLLVGLVATAGFVVVAQRRTRQLGMLASIGATGRHLRFVVLVNGAAVGVVAATVGAVVALAAWAGIGPALEGVAGHRIARFDVPWWVVVVGMLLAVATATAAAWWPARTTSHVPITDALSARPPIAKPARRSATAAVVLAALGFAGLAAGVDTRHNHVNQLLLLPGIVAIVAAVVLIGPLAIGALATAGARLPIAARLALRDLARHRARSASALAAIGVGLGIAVAIVVIAAGAQHSGAEGNLSKHQLLVSAAGDGFVPVSSAAQRRAQRTAVEHLTRSLDHPAVFSIEAAAASTTNQLEDGREVQPLAELLRPAGAHSFNGLGRLYIATPALLAHAGVRAAAIPANAEVLTSETGDLFVGAGNVFASGAANKSKVSTRRGDDLEIRITHVDTNGYTSVPRSFITPAAMRRLGLPSVQYGWLFEQTRPFTSAQLSGARDLAARVGLRIETRDAQHGLGTTRTIATIAGMLLALAILAMTVGLIRSEAGRDLRTLTAAGATSGTRRMLAAATAGALAFLGVVIGAVAAYLALVAGYLHDLDPLRHVPVVHLLVMVIGIPLVAAVAGWLAGGREPPLVARAVLD